MTRDMICSCHMLFWIHTTFGEFVCCKKYCAVLFRLM